MKMVLTGRPKETIERDGYVVAHMESTAPKNCPRGLPTPPTQGMTWMVLIAERQWRAVTPALRQDKEDRLIVEGQPCQVDGNNILYATSVVTMGQQRAKKEAQRLAAVGKE